MIKEIQNHVDQQRIDSKNAEQEVEQLNRAKMIIQTRALESESESDDLPLSPDEPLPND